MMQRLARIGELRELLQQMEGDLGLTDLSRFERDLLYAVRMLAGSSGVAATADLRAHPLVADMTQPTFHRALRTLIDRGLIRRLGEERARYAMVDGQAG